MFKSDETAKELFRRLQLPPIHFPNIGKLEYGDICEVQVGFHDKEQATLSILLEYFNSCSNKGCCYHVSNNSNFYSSISQSGINLQGTSLLNANTEERVLQCQVYHIIELKTIFQHIINNLNGKPSLLLLDNISSVLYAEKGYDLKDGSSQQQSSDQQRKSIADTFDMLQTLRKAQNVIILWLTAAVPIRHSGCLRDPMSKDFVSISWRRNIPRLMLWKGGC